MTEDNLKKDVKLFKQTYQEFASQGLEERLEPIGIVGVFAGSRENLYDSKLEKLNEELRKEAERLGGTHIFGIVYTFGLPSNFKSIIFACGDAYKPKKDKTGPYR